MSLLLIIIALFAVAILLQQFRLSPRADMARIPASFRIATWNVHYIWLEQEEGRWGLSGWEARKRPMAATFQSLEADIVAFQEMESFSRRGSGNVNLKRDYLLKENPAFAAAATGDARAFPPTQPIFYREEKFALRDQGWFFFSETPDRLYSRGFDGASPSFASWAIFETKEDGKRFRVVNIHPDAFSRRNRRASIALTAQRLEPWLAASETIFLLGDFNALHGSSLLRVFEDKGIVFPRQRGATLHFSRGIHLFGAIDHIGGTDAALFRGKPQVFNRKTGPVWGSDHHPVFADVSLD